MNTDKIRMGTEAYHQLGDLSRDEPEFFWVDSEDADNYYGAWLTGFGFVNVRFPKSTTRVPSRFEIEWLADHPVYIS
jgi:hypothetical protein